MCCIPRNGAPQPEGVKCKLKNSLWSSSNKEKTKKLETQTTSRALNFQKESNDSKHIFRLIISLQYVTPLSSQWLHTYSWRKKEKRYRGNHHIPSQTDVKAWAILRAWSHTELKQAGRKASHAEDSSSIIQSSSWSTVWSWYHHTAQVSGSTVAPQCTWLGTEAGRLPDGTRHLWRAASVRPVPRWAWAAGSHLVSPFKNKPVTCASILLTHATANSKLLLALS